MYVLFKTMLPTFIMGSYWVYLAVMIVGVVGKVAGRWTVATLCQPAAAP
jgi:hypothetical protein